MSVDPSFENALSFAADLIRIPGLPGHEEAVSRRVLGEFERLGFEDARIDDGGNVIGVVKGVGSAPPALLNCHLDVVAEGDHDEWDFPPFGGVVADGALHGRGAMDIKGPLALQTYTAAAMAGTAPGDVLVAHTVLEERGGLGMKLLLESKTVTPGVVIIGEATNGDVCIGHRGRAEVEIVIRGTAGHASAPERAHNVLDLLGDVLAAAGTLGADQPSDPVLGRATCTPTMVDVKPESRNVIPDLAVVCLDWRILPGSTDASLLERVAAALADRVPTVPDGLSVEVRLASEHQRTWTGLAEEKNLLTPGFLMEAGHPAVEAAARAVGKVDDVSRPAAIRPWTFATDGGWSCGVHGIPTVGFAPGEERFAHTNRERLDIEQARWAFGRYPHLVAAVQTAIA